MTLKDMWQTIEDSCEFLTEKDLEEDYALWISLLNESYAKWFAMYYKDA